jgi:hypothetical protein
MEMGNPVSVVHAFIGLGMSEHDAWRCVHLLQARDSIVLLTVERADSDLAPANGPPAVDNAMIAVAAEGGASLTCDAGGRWYYLRGLRWGIAQVEELRAELSELAQTLDSRPVKEA